MLNWKLILYLIIIMSHVWIPVHVPIVFHIGALSTCRSHSIVTI